MRRALPPATMCTTGTRHGLVSSSQGYAVHGSWDRPDAFVLWQGDERKTNGSAEAVLHALAPTDGLLFIHSHGQPREAYENSAHMLRLSSGTNPLVLRLSLVVANNNAMLNASALESWVVQQPYPMATRMMLKLAKNAGFNCGEFHSLNASRWLWSHFPWVLYTSGPDNLLGPAAFQHIEAAMRPMVAAIHLETFPHAKHHPKWALDVVAFNTSQIHINDSWSFWLNCVVECTMTTAERVAKFGRYTPPPIPETVLERVRDRMRLQSTPLNLGRLPSLSDKRTRQKPFPSGWWHSHNATAVHNWLDGAESAREGSSSRASR